MNNLPDTNKKLATRRKISETLASFGMVLIAVGIFLPLLNITGTGHLDIWVWVFMAGALMFWGGRCIPVSDDTESVKLRRLRRIEFWAGACFGVAAFFWFYNLHKFHGNPMIGPLTILRDPILFSLAGAVLQLIAAWMIYFRQRKEAKNS